MHILDSFDVLNLLRKQACALFSSDDYQLLMANECFEDWNEVPPDASVFDIYPEMSAKRFTRGIEKRGRFSYQTTATNVLGNAIDIQLAFQKIERDDQEFVFLHGVDRSREKEKDAILARQTQLLERRNKELERLNRDLTEAHDHLLMASKLTALGEMATSMILEMRTPLQLVMVNASFLEEHLRDQEATEMLQNITQSSSHINKIVENLHGLARREVRDPMQRRDVAGIVDDTLRLCRKRIEDSGIDLEVADIDGTLTVDCHPTELAQVLLNLINNAAEALDGDDDAWIKLDATRDGEDAAAGYVQFSVTDSGGGLPASLAEKLFEPFFSTKDVGAGYGTGLGLTISRKIVQRHQGTLTLDTESEDTRFVARLPLAEEEGSEDESAPAA